MIAENLQRLEKTINSELSSKIKNSFIQHNELLIEIKEEELIEVVQFFKSKIFLSQTKPGIEVFPGNTLSILRDITNFF